MNLILLHKGQTLMQPAGVAAIPPAILRYKAFLFVGVALCLTQLRQLGARLRTAIQWPYPAMGALLTLLSHSLGIRLGGPRYYQDTLFRFPVFDAVSDPDASSALRLLNRLQQIGWGWLALAVLFTALE